MSRPLNSVSCKQFTDQLDAWISGERSAAARVHARECPQCRNMAEDFAAIGRAAREWSLEDAEPSPRLWSALRAQLQEEGLIRDRSRNAATVAAQPQPQAAASNPAGWFAALFSGPLRPALAGAYLALLIAVSILFVGPSGKQMDDSQWLARTQTSVKPLNAELDSAEHAVLSDLATANPVVSASFHQNLAIIDRDIVLCEKSVREEPGNELARDYLYEAYEQKADLLDQMADRGVGQ
jgi:hypothetical protein